jgi:hypothetical protein
MPLSCRFCRGLGYYVGDNNDPAEATDTALPYRPVWEEPAVRTLALCRVCFGARTVVNLGGTGEPTGELFEMPCPACSADNSGS